MPRGTGEASLSARTIGWSEPARAARVTFGRSSAGNCDTRHVRSDGEPAQHLVRLSGRAGPGRNDLAQVVPALGEQVLACVDDDAEGAAGQLLDAALGAGTTSRLRGSHGETLDRIRTTNRTTSVDNSGGMFPLVRKGRAEGIQTLTP